MPETPTMCMAAQAAGAWFLKKNAKENNKTRH